MSATLALATASGRPQAKLRPMSDASAGPVVPRERHGEEEKEKWKERLIMSAQAEGVRGRAGRTRRRKWARNRTGK